MSVGKRCMLGGWEFHWHAGCDPYFITPEGKYIDEWGGFLQPCDLYVDSDNIMYVAELQARVTIIDLNGNVQARLGDPEVRKSEPGKFIGPHGVWVDRHGDLYVSEVLMGQRIQKFIRK